GVDHVRVGRGDRDGAEGDAVLVVEDRRPGLALVGGLPQAAGRGGDEDVGGVVLDDGQVHDAAAHVGGADRPRAQGVEQPGIDGDGGGRGGLPGGRRRADQVQGGQGGQPGHGEEGSSAAVHG